MPIEFILLGIFIALAFTSESITGFGSIVIALALGSLLFPIPELLPILVPLSVVMSTSLLVRFHNDINWSLLLSSVLPLMLFGMLGGIALLQVVSSEALKAAFAILILWFACREWYKLYRQPDRPAKPRWWQPLWTFIAGITHGLFASGGPLLVYALSTRGISKGEFRATLVSVWFILNVIYSSIMWVQGVIQPVVPVVLSYVPVLFVALWFGHSIHKRVNEFQFRQIVYALLILSATAMLWSAL